MTENNLTSLSLNNRIAVITGAKQGIGAAVAIGFARRGAKVVLWDWADIKEASESITKVSKYCNDPLYLQVDVSDKSAVTEAAERTLEYYGKVDILVNNAAIYPRIPFLEMTFEEWQKVVDISLSGSWLCAKAFVPNMINQSYGKIINVSSILFVLGAPDFSHYIPAKAGVIGLTRSLARELGVHGIRVNAVMPGAIQTEGELRDFPDQEKISRILNEKQCLPGRIKPEHIEPTFAFLAGSSSDPITGQTINVDHGWCFW